MSISRGEIAGQFHGIATREIQTVDSAVIIQKAPASIAFLNKEYGTQEIYEARVLDDGLIIHSRANIGASIAHRYSLLTNEYQKEEKP